MSDTALIWNHRIHQRWASEDLTFWRLAFFPRYRQEQVLKSVVAVMREHGVRSFAIYETLGLFDLFIRAWLPSQTLEQFEQTLNTALEGEYLQLLEPFSVTRILRHHIWDSPDGKLREPSEATMATKWDDDLLDRVNRGDLSNQELREYEKQNVVARITPGDGIKFFTVITSALFSVTWRARLKLENDLLKILNKHKITEPSLYEGSGFGQFILMGRAPLDQFFEIPKLAYEINDLGINDSVTARPYTHVCACQDLLHYSDEMPTDSARQTIDVLALLDAGESQRVEIKGSAKLNLKRWLNTDEPSPKGEDIVLNEGVIRAIVGMLNADGGHIVIGALERDRLFGSHVAKTHPKLAGYETHGDYICIGVNDEEIYRQKGWDGYRLQLQEFIASRIDPPPAGAISMTRFTLPKGRDLCVVAVSPSRATWFYRVLGPGEPVMFYVREDGRTVAHAGAAADAYKRARPRG